jgi:hypothetical protein
MMTSWYFFYFCEWYRRMSRRTGQPRTGDWYGGYNKASFLRHVGILRKTVRTVRIEVAGERHHQRRVKRRVVPRLLSGAADIIMLTILGHRVTIWGEQHTRTLAKPSSIPCLDCTPSQGCFNAGLFVLHADEPLHILLEGFGNILVHNSNTNVLLAMIQWHRAHPNSQRARVEFVDPRPSQRPISGASPPPSATDRLYNSRMQEVDCVELLAMLLLLSKQELFDALDHTNHTIIARHLPAFAFAEYQRIRMMLRQTDSSLGALWTEYPHPSHTYQATYNALRVAAHTPRQAISQARRYAFAHAMDIVSAFRIRDLVRTDEQRPIHLFCGNAHAGAIAVILGDMFRDDCVVEFVRSAMGRMDRIACLDLERGVLLMPEPRHRVEYRDLRELGAEGRALAPWTAARSDSSWTGTLTSSVRASTDSTWTL